MSNDDLKDKDIKLGQFTSSILKFGYDGTEENKDIYSLEDYENMDSRKTGNQPGLAQRALVNTVLLNTTVFTSALSEFLVLYSETNYANDLNSVIIYDTFINMFKVILTPEFLNFQPTLTGTGYPYLDDGVVNYFDDDFVRTRISAQATLSGTGFVKLTNDVVSYQPIDLADSTSAGLVHVAPRSQTDTKLVGIDQVTGLLYYTPGGNSSDNGVQIDFGETHQGIDYIHTKVEAQKEALRLFGNLSSSTLPMTVALPYKMWVEQTGFSVGSSIPTTVPTITYVTDIAGTVNSFTITTSNNASNARVGFHVEGIVDTSDEPSNPVLINSTLTDIMLKLQFDKFETIVPCITTCLIRQVGELTWQPLQSDIVTGATITIPTNFRTVDFEIKLININTTTGTESFPSITVTHRCLTNVISILYTNNRGSVTITTDAYYPDKNCYLNLSYNNILALRLEMNNAPVNATSTNQLLFGQKGVTVPITSTIEWLFSSVAKSVSVARQADYPIISFQASNATVAVTYFNDTFQVGATLNWTIRPNFWYERKIDTTLAMITEFPNIYISPNEQMNAYVELWEQCGIQSQIGFVKTLLTGRAFNYSPNITFVNQNNTVRATCTNVPTDTESVSAEYFSMTYYGSTSSTFDPQIVIARWDRVRTVNPQNQIEQGVFGNTRPLYVRQRFERSAGTGSVPTIFSRYSINTYVKPVMTSMSLTGVKSLSPFGYTLNWTSAIAGAYYVPVINSVGKPVTQGLTYTHAIPAQSYNDTCVVNATLGLVKLTSNTLNIADVSFNETPDITYRNGLGIVFITVNNIPEKVKANGWIEIWVGNTSNGNDKTKLLDFNFRASNPLSSSSELLFGTSKYTYIWYRYRMIVDKVTLYGPFVNINYPLPVFIGTPRVPTYTQYGTQCTAKLTIMPFTNGGGYSNTDLFKAGVLQVRTTTPLDYVIPNSTVSFYCNIQYYCGRIKTTSASAQYVPVVPAPVSGVHVIQEGSTLLIRWTQQNQPGVYRSVLKDGVHQASGITASEHRIPNQKTNCTIQVFSYSGELNANTQWISAVSPAVSYFPQQYIEIGSIIFDRNVAAFTIPAPFLIGYNTGNIQFRLESVSGTLNYPTASMTPYRPTMFFSSLESDALVTFEVPPMVTFWTCRAVTENTDLIFSQRYACKRPDTPAITFDSNNYYVAIHFLKLDVPFSYGLHFSYANW